MNWQDSLTLLIVVLSFIGCVRALRRDIASKKDCDSCALRNLGRPVVKDYHLHSYTNFLNNTSQSNNH